jgi:hypothetical protein
MRCVFLRKTKDAVDIGSVTTLALSVITFIMGLLVPLPLFHIENINTVRLIFFMLFLVFLFISWTIFYLYYKSSPLPALMYWYDYYVSRKPLYIFRKRYIAYTLGYQNNKSDGDESSKASNLLMEYKSKSEVTCLHNNCQLFHGAFRWDGDPDGYEMSPLEGKYQIIFKELDETDEMRNRTSFVFRFEKQYSFKDEFSMGFMLKKLTNKNKGVRNHLVCKITAPTKLVNLKVIFKNNLHPINMRIVAYSPGQIKIPAFQEDISFSDSDEHSDDSNVLFYKIHFPRFGYSYVLEWDWGNDSFPIKKNTE